MIVLIIIVLGTVLLLHYLFPLVQVVGDSMSDTYLEGEILVGRRLFLKSKLKVGDVIVYQSPEDRKRKVIKRIALINNDPFYGRIFYCLGDNAPHSYDSRNYGYIHCSNLVCRVKTRPKKEIKRDVCT